MSFIESPFLFLENSTPFVDWFWGGLPAKILYITKGQEVESNTEYSNQITELQEKVHNIQNILERPNNINIEDQEQKTAFINSPYAKLTK